MDLKDHSPSWLVDVNDHSLSWREVKWGALILAGVSVAPQLAHMAMNHMVI